jgi:uncharacterized protein YdeI (YjbR/CyaY-like superfamily)
VDDVYFPTVADLRTWFEANHDKLDVAWFGFYKVGTGVPSITYKDAVDECLCFGWIDGVRYTVDDQRWRERFTPRRAGSFWSTVNTKRALELINEGRMTPAGLAAFEARDQSRTQRIDAERAGAALTAEEEAIFRRHANAWAWFEAAPPSYRKPAIAYVATAKRAETRQKRLETLIADSAAGRKLRPLTRPSERVD